MKSRTNKRGINETGFVWEQGKNSAVKTLVLATALTLLVQPMPAFAKVFAKNDGAGSALKISAKTDDTSKEDKKEAAKAKKEAEKAKKAEEKKAKESGKNDKDKSAKDKDADKAADSKVKGKEQAKDESDKDKKAKGKKEEVEKETKKVDEKKADKEKVSEDDKTAKKKKKGWFGKSKDGDDEEVIVEEEIIEVAPEETKKPAASAKSGATTTAKPAAAKPATKEATEAPVTTDAEKPVLLPDKALVSVLQDISKALADVNEETGIESEDEKTIVGLARQILDKALGTGDLKDNRILAPEHNQAAKTSMIAEAWASGDIAISDKLRGSVATVWGKRINGMLNVTIAGECTDKTLSNGEKVGEFIVVVKGHSPVKSGFDIQSQSDVTYWIGAVSAVSVDAACCRFKEKAKEGDTEGDEDKDSAAPEKSGENKGDVKKKSTLVLEAVLTRRGLDYLQALAKYQEGQQALLAQAQAEAAVAEAESAITDDTEVAKKARKSDDEVDDERTARRARPAYDEDDDEKTVRRARPAYDEDDDEKTVRRARPADDEVDDEKTARRARPSDDEAVSEKTTRRARPADDEAVSEKTTRRARPADDEAVSEKTTRRARPNSDEVDSEKTVRRPRSNDDDVDSDRDTRPSEDEPQVATKKKFDSAWEGKSPPPPTKTASSAATNGGDQWRDDWSKDGEQRQERVTQTPKIVETKKPAPELFTAQTESKQKPVELTRISMVSPSPAPASAVSRAWESPAVNASVRAPSLGATLLLPDRAVAGQFVTVTVVGKDRQPERAVELSFNGATLATDVNGQVLYMVPDDMTPGPTLNISLAARPELSPGVIDIFQPLGDESDQRSPQIDKVSRLVASDSVLIIDGHDFDGIADKNRVVIDSMHEARVLSASPVQLRVLMPAKIYPGTHTVTLNHTALRSTPAKFDFVKAEIDQPDPIRRLKGTIDRLVVRVQGTKQPVPVRIVNRSPEVLKVLRGDNMLVTTSGGDNNSYALGVKQLKKGDYKVDASIEI